MRGDKIEALTICVNYADYFEHVARANHKIFSKWVVVTDTKDIETPKICEKFGLICVKTDVFYKDGASFNKAAGMNEGLKYISSDAFVVFLDADIVLHELTRHSFNNLEFKKDVLYGIDRLICKGYDKYIAYCSSPHGIIKDNWLMHNCGMEWGARICQYYGIHGENGRFRGWLPLGFFQLVYRGAFDVVPTGNSKADHYDIEFGMKFSRENRMFIPEIMGIHLESSGHWKGQNWSGRVSPPFIALPKIEKYKAKEEVKETLCQKIKKKLKL